MRSRTVFRLFIIFFLLLIQDSTKSYAQDDWLHGWREATVAIGVLDTVKQISNCDTLKFPFFRVIGTGVIFASPDTSNKIPFLVTAKHVFFDPNENWDPSDIRLRFSWFQDKPVWEYLGIEVKLKDDDSNRLWIPHPEDYVDIAIIPLHISKKEVGRESLTPVRIENLANHNEVFEGASLLLFGYPGSVGPKYWSKPIVRHGTIAYVNETRFGKEPILIDSMIFPGNSGGPVFTIPTGMTKSGLFKVSGRSIFLGIVSAAHRHLESVEKSSMNFINSGADSSDTHYQSFDYMGLGIIEPAQRVQELLNLTYQ